MAYDKDKFQLTKLLQASWMRLGQMRTWIVTGGSTTTVVNTDWALPEEPVFEDDDPSLLLGTAVVIEDAGGLGAAPEGEMSMITDYDSASSTATIDTITAAVASGDKVGIVSPLFPLADMVALANIALGRLGELDLVDTSITTASGTTEYTLPTTVRKPIARIRIKRDDVNWEVLNGWNLIPATAGSNWTLVVPESTDGQLEIMYRGKHPIVNTYDDDIADILHPELAVCAVVAEAYQWYNNMLGGSNQYFLQRENKAIQDLEAARVMYPVGRYPGQVQGFVHWTV